MSWSPTIFVAAISYVHTCIIINAGCDTGFGHALVKKLDSIGMRVYATCLLANSPGAIALRNNCSERYKKIGQNILIRF